MVTVAIAGGTGDLGGRIAAALCGQAANVRALVRRGANAGALARLRALGCSVETVDFSSISALAHKLDGADVVVSALSGVAPAIVEGQGRLVDAAVRAGVPRFMPSDFSIDFRGYKSGTNRNLDLRRIFMGHLDEAPIRATSVLNGMFMDLLTGQAPMVVRPMRRVVHWGPANQRLDFTTIDDTAAFAARAALDDHAPRWLRIAGKSSSAQGVARSASAAFETTFRTLRAGLPRLLAALIAVTRRVSPAENETFPAWQGMQYFHSMVSGGVDFGPVDNDRYGPRRWTTVEEALRRGPSHPASL